MTWAGTTSSRRCATTGATGSTTESKATAVARTNFTEALEPWGIAEWQIPDPFNFFQNAPIHPDRTFGNEIPTGKARDKLVLRTLMDSIVSVSACPQDLNPCNGFHPSPLMIRILEPSRGPS